MELLLKDSYRRVFIEIYICFSRFSTQKDTHHIMKTKNTHAAIIDLVPFSEQLAAANRWQDLERSIGNTGLTNYWLWIKTWLDNYSDTVQTSFAFGHRDSQTN